MFELQPLYTAILEGDAPAARSTAQAAIHTGVDPRRLLDEFMVPAMDEVGRRFEAGDYFVPELLIAARAMRGAMEVVRPLLAERGAEPAGRVIIGAVRGDLHDIGKNLVAAMLEGGGFEVIDLGVDVHPASFVEAIRDMSPDIVAISALLTTTMPGMRAAIDAMKEAGVRDRVRIMVGGAPITQRYADEIGADGFSDNASAAVRIARELVGARSGMRGAHRGGLQ